MPPFTPASTDLQGSVAVPSAGAAELVSPPSFDALRGYATLLRGVLDVLPFGVAVLDRNGMLTTWNDELSALLPAPLGRGGAHGLGMLVRELGRIVADAVEFE